MVRSRALLGSFAGAHILTHNNDTAPEHQVAFTIGMIALGAKMAKADGLVTEDEIIAFKEVFRVPDGEMKNVSRIFNLAKQDIIGYEAYAKQLASLLKDNGKLLEHVIDGLFHIAMADGVFKRHYRRLVLDNHSDKMIARGVPPEFVSLATKKVAAINAAYEAVARERHI